MTARCITLAVALLAIVACQDITRSTIATREVTEDTVIVFPLRGSPLSAPTALDLFQVEAMRLDQVGLKPDVAIDTSGSGVVLYPSQLIVDSDVLNTETGLLEVTSNFDSIPEALTSGYQDTAAVAVSVGETVLVRAGNVCFGGFPGRDFFYSKLQLLEITTSSGFRSARFRIRSNPNCGFRSFADGLPEF
jgi:hypothetical protein